MTPKQKLLKRAIKRSRKSLESLYCSSWVKDFGSPINQGSTPPKDCPPVERKADEHSTR